MGNLEDPLGVMIDFHLTLLSLKATRLDHAYRNTLQREPRAHTHTQTRPLPFPLEWKKLKQILAPAVKSWKGVYAS